MVWPWYWQVGQPTQNFTVVFDTGPGVSFFFGHDVVIGSKSDEFARFWSPFPTRCFVQGKGEKDGKGNVSIQNRYSLPTACISSLYADIFWQDQVCMKHGRYDRSLSVACLRISSTFHVTLINVTNSGICRRDQRGWESSCQREAASGLPDIGKPSFHQIICIYIYICIHHTFAASSCDPRILYAIRMHTSCALVKAWHGLHLLWHWWGCRWLCERCCGLGQTWFKLQNSMFLLFLVLFTLCFIWCPASGSWNNWFLW